MQAIVEIRRGLAIEPHDLAQSLGVDTQTVDLWEKGHVYPQQEGRACLDTLLELARNASVFFATLEDVHGWLRNSNRYLGGLTPLEAIRAGRTDRARAALGVMQWGIGI
jgi:DNA-binding XRE family transcriptional regulator